MENIMEILKQKFSSGNDVAVERIVLTRKEYDALLEHIGWRVEEAFYDGYNTRPFD